MATHENLQLSTLIFNPTLQESPSQPPHSFYNVNAQLKAIPGVTKIYLGRQIEYPDRWTWAVRWATGAALDAFLASPTYTDWLTSLRAVVDSVASTRSYMRGDLGAALCAPCTEIFSAYEADPDFIDTRVKPFSRCFDPEYMPGYKGLAFGQWQHMAHLGVAAPAGNSVSMLLGWDSKEAHLAQRGDGKSTFNLTRFPCIRHN